MNKHWDLFCNSYSLVLGRALLALLFLVAGYGKIMNYAGTADFMISVGMPVVGILLPLAIAIEVLGGLALLVGLRTRTTAGVLIIFTAIASVMFHANISDQLQMTMLLKNLAIIGGLLYVYAHGAGSCSLDNRKQA